MNNKIIKRLRDIEVGHRVVILYAAETGSRARGLASADCDYDVRFIYAHHRNWYLSIDVESRSETLDFPVLEHLDCAGWDIRKALNLFMRTSAALLEWLYSPITYIDIGPLAARLRKLWPHSVNTAALCYHYSHLARDYAHALPVGGDKVRLKKCLGALRAVLAIRYIELKGVDPPPVEFDKLAQAVAPAGLAGAITELIELKRTSPRAGVTVNVGGGVVEFITAELDRHDQGFEDTAQPRRLSKQKRLDELNELFRAALRLVH